jgi:hypothetical protein
MGDVSEKWVIEDRSARAEKQQHFSCISVQWPSCGTVDRQIAISLDAHTCLAHRSNVDSKPLPTH